MFALTTRVPARFRASSALLLSGCVLAASGAGPLTSTARAATVNLTSLSADASPTETGLVIRAASTSLVTGANDEAGGNLNVDAASVIVFQLPTLAVGETVSTASLTFRAAQGGTPTYNADLYGLGFRNVGTVLASDYFEGSVSVPLDTTDATVIEDNILTPGIVTGGFSTSTTGSAALVAYLNDQYAAGAGGNFVFLRFSPDNEPADGTRYFVGSNENTTQKPILNFTTSVPEPASAAFAFVAGAASLLNRRSRRPALV